MQKKEIYNNNKFQTDSPQEITYISVPKKSLSECYYIAEMYNSCIEADNLIFPFSSYKKCLDETNALFLCDKIEKYNALDQDVVS